jgi:hypothetical protein
MDEMEFMQAIAVAYNRAAELQELALEPLEVAEVEAGKELGRHFRLSYTIRCIKFLTKLNIPCIGFPREMPEFLAISYAFLEGLSEAEKTTLVSQAQQCVNDITQYISDIDDLIPMFGLPEQLHCFRSSTIRPALVLATDNKAIAVIIDILLKRLGLDPAKGASLVYDGHPQAYRWWFYMDKFSPAILGELLINLEMDLEGQAPDAYFEEIEKLFQKFPALPKTFEHYQQNVFLRPDLIFMTNNKATNILIAASVVKLSLEVYYGEHKAIDGSVFYSWRLPMDNAPLPLVESLLEEMNYRYLKSKRTYRPVWAPAPAGGQAALAAPGSAASLECSTPAAGGAGMQSPDN